MGLSYFLRRFNLLCPFQVRSTVYVRVAYHWLVSQFGRSVVIGGVKVDRVPGAMGPLASAP